jgi:hypothetical protein
MVVHVVVLVTLMLLGLAWARRGYTRRLGA